MTAIDTKSCLILVLLSFCIQNNGVSCSDLEPASVHNNLTDADGILRKLKLWQKQSVQYTWLVICQNSFFAVDNIAQASCTAMNQQSGWIFGDQSICSKNCS